LEWFGGGIASRLCPHQGEIDWDIIAIRVFLELDVKSPQSPRNVDKHTPFRNVHTNTTMSHVKG